MKAKENNKKDNFIVRSEESLYQIYLDLSKLFRQLDKIRGHFFSSHYCVVYDSEHSCIRIIAPTLLDVPTVINLVRAMGLFIDSIENNTVSIFFYGDYEAGKSVSNF